MKKLILKIVASVIIICFGVIYIFLFDEDNFASNSKPVVKIPSFSTLTAKK